MTTSRLPLLLIGLAALAALVLISDGPLVVHAQTNQDATGRPRVLAAAQGAGILFADTEGIDDGNGLPITITSSYAVFHWSYQWIRVDGNSETNVGANSATYRPVQADVGKLIKVRVSFTDADNFSEARSSLPFGPIVEPASTLSPSKLVSNTGQTPSTTANITQQYAIGFSLGDHGQGYEISSVSIDLAAVPSSLTVSLWSGGHSEALQPNNANKLFDFANPSSFAVGLNEFTAPAGAFAYQNVNYFIVLSGFGSSLSINETTSDNEDSGGETGVVIYNYASVRALSETGLWSISSDSSYRESVLRLAVKGSQRARGIIASNYAQPFIDDKGTVDTSDDTSNQEIISVGDKIGFGIELGAADRYLIRGVSFISDDTTPSRGGFTNPLDLRSGSRTGAKQFTLVNSRNATGLTVWTAPRGATVAGATGGKAYVFDQPVGKDDGDEKTRRRDAILFRVAGAAADGIDSPAAAGVSFTGGKGDIALNDPYMAVLGEPLEAMVQNLGQTNNGYVSADTTNDVLSQGFTTGPSIFGYRLQGIGVNIEGSGSNYPDGPTSVSVAVHANSSGKPGAKLVDLISPDEFGAGHSFFEAPPGTHLRGGTSYVLVWSHLGGTVHRLRKTSSDSEDLPALVAFSIADAFYRGTRLSLLREDSGDNSVEIAVYGETNRETVVFAEVPVEPPEPPFDPDVTGGGPGHFGGDAILRCSVPPPDTCPSYNDVSGQRTIWSATMTVGQLGIEFIQGIGYEAIDLATFGTLSDDTASLPGRSYTVDRLKIYFPTITNLLELGFDSAPGDIANNLTLHLGSTSFRLSAATLSAHGDLFTWTDHGLTWSENESIEVRLTEPPLPNAYGYRTIWTALMTAGDLPNSTDNGYNRQTGNNAGEITNDLIVHGRDETVTIGTPGKPRYPWTGYRVESLVASPSVMDIGFGSDSYPNLNEVAGWTLVLDGQEFPFVEATQNTADPSLWEFPGTPGAFTVGQQVLVSIRNDDVQNRIGKVDFKSRRSTRVNQTTKNIVYGKTHFSYDHEPDKFGPADGWELRSLTVTTDKTGDTDPVWIRATFRASGSGAAGRAWQGWWEGQFDDFHTLFLRWIYHEGGIGKGEATYTLPLRAASGIGLSQSGRDVTFTWVRTYKEFQDRHLDLANHSYMSAHMLGAPQPATARAGGEGGDGEGGDDDSPQAQRQYVPTTVTSVTSVDFTSNPGSDQVYGPWSTIQVTVAFSEDVTVGYDGLKKHAAQVDLEMGGETRTAYYARTEGNRVILEYTVVPGDEETFGLLFPANSLRLDIRVAETGNWKRRSWIRNSEGQDAVLDHLGLGSTSHRVDAVSPEFASAQVSTDGTEVAVTFDESIRSPAMLRAYGVQTSLLQSLALDVRVDGELAARSDAALSGDTVTQGQTVAVSYDNFFVERGESIFEDLHSNKLAPFSPQPVTNGSTVADVERPDGGLTLSRTDLMIKEGDSGAYTVALASQPASDVTVEISQRPPGRATVSLASLTFTADNWSTPQTVTITSTEDANYVDRWVLLRHVATGDDYGASAAAWLILRDGYNVGTATPNTRATGAPTISGTPQVGQTLTLDTSAIADADGLTHASYTYLYQWLRNNAKIKGATGTSYTLVNADRDKTIKVKVSFLDDANNQESRTSAATVAVAPLPNNAPTGAPTISGTPQVGETLTLDTSAIDDADGLTHASYTYLYQWLRNNAKIKGATGTSYTLVNADRDKTIKVKVSFLDDANNQESRTSAATVAVAPLPNNAPTGAPTISGTPQVGETLTADTSAIDDADGLTNVAYRYQWVGSQPVTDEDTGTSSILTVEKPEQTDPTYTLLPADEGLTYQVKVSFTDDAGNAESLTSAATEAVTPPPSYEPTGLPAITGTPQVGETLTADTSAIDDADGLTNVAYRYQWLGSQSVIDANTGTTYYVNVEIPGATGSTYTLAPADKGRIFAVRVSFTDDRGNSESLTSRYTVIVAAKPNSEPTGLPAITGTPQVGQTLTADTSAIDDADGLTNVSYEYRWTARKTVVDENTGTSFPVFPVLSGDTNSTYTLAPADQGYTFQVRVTFTDDADNQESLTSEATVAVAVAAPAPLTAAFQDLPDSHGGSTAFAFRVLFSEDVGISYVNMRDDAFSLSEGDVTGARRVDGRNDLWEITVEPDGDDGVAVTLTGNRSCTTAGAICTREDSPRQLTNSPTATVTGPAEEPSTNTSAAGAPTISGTPQVEQTLTADTSSITDEDGLTNVSYSYQWIAGGSDIAGATGSTYTLTPSEQGQTVQVRVTFTDDADNEETLTSAATVAVAAAPNRDATGAPTIGGTPQVGETLTADTSPIDDEDGLTNATFEYQWVAGGSDISGATGSTYTLTSSEEGQTVQVRVTFTDDADNDESLTSVATDAVAAAAAQTNNPATGAPAIGGTPQVGETLTADTSPIDDADGLTNVSYRYQWMAGGSDIAGATGSSYTLTSSEEGQTVQVRVSFTDDADNDESLTSVATDSVAAAPVLLTVRLKVAAPTNHDGSSEFTFEIEFSEEFGLSYVTLRDFAFTETGGEVRKAQRMDKPSNIRWLITVEPQGNGDVTIVLPVTTDCNADGAICTGDGRKLSNSLSFTVSGPGG